VLSCSGLAGLNWASCGLWSAGHLELLVKVGHAHLLDSDWPWLPWGTVTRPLVPRPQQICPGSAQGQLPKASCPRPAGVQHREPSLLIFGWN
jgi:hypothetical protein